MLLGFKVLPVHMVFQDRMVPKGRRVPKAQLGSVDCRVRKVTLGPPVPKANAAIRVFPGSAVCQGRTVSKVRQAQKVLLGSVVFQGRRAPTESLGSVVCLVPKEMWGARGHAARPVLPVLRVSTAFQVLKANGEILACPASVVLEARKAMMGLVYN